MKGICHYLIFFLFDNRIFWYIATIIYLNFFITENSRYIPLFEFFFFFFFLGGVGPWHLTNATRSLICVLGGLTVAFDKLLWVPCMTYSDIYKKLIINVQLPFCAWRIAQHHRYLEFFFAKVRQLTFNI